VNGGGQAIIILKYRFQAHQKSLTPNPDAAFHLVTYFTNFRRSSCAWIVFRMYFCYQQAVEKA